ncbi:MAG: 16S rRNA (guanine(527)-N(7))-methyltransferase RsmG [Actinomycetota bacterium]|nr:16S rRNA (guanine(527)-N(7))-methyltransferase RsmG [Actinomycetota bacterium]
MLVADGAPLPVPPQAARLFGERMALAERYVALLAGPGVERGVVGPRETARLWERHMLNCAVIGDLVPRNCRVLDVGSGAGLPGIPLVLARPDLTVLLLEPMARRVAWLEEVIADLDLPVAVHRGRAEQPEGRVIGQDWDVVTARAVAPLGRLAAWCLPLVRTGGQLLALKGASAAEEAARDGGRIRRAGGDLQIAECGVAVVEPPTTVVVVTRRRVGTAAAPRTRKDRRA